MLYSYKFESNSAKSLTEALGIKRIKHEGSKFKGNPKKTVINWGATALPHEVLNCKVINTQEAVSLATNKLKFFNHVKDKINLPDFTTDREEAKAWVEAGSIVLARTVLNGHSGVGIYVIEDMGEWNKIIHDAIKVYVKYIPKKEEYRVHVVEGHVIDVRRKALRKDFAGQPNWKVRNHGNGFIFAKEGVNPPQEVIDQSLLAVAACNLNFGAVDVIYNNFKEKAYVLEINTAPGLEGSTAGYYAEAFKHFYFDQNNYNPNKDDALKKMFGYGPVKWEEFLVDVGGLEDDNDEYMVDEDEEEEDF